MKIFIDNGHGLMTAGKRSPDGQFREAFYNREIVKRVVADLVDRGYDAELLLPEDDDVSLEERVRRVSAARFLLGKANVILVSIHVNAAGNGSKWMNATAVVVSRFLVPLRRFPVPTFSPDSTTWLCTVVSRSWRILQLSRV